MGTVGDRIKQRREALGLSQMQLAIKMGYNNRSAISRAETSGDEIGANRVKKFAEALNCTPAYLMGWKDVDFVVEDDDLEFFTEAYRRADDATKEMVRRILSYKEQFDKLKGE